MVDTKINGRDIANNKPQALDNWFSKIRTDCFPGRELFMTDTTLNESDLKFLAEAGDTAVTVDESLFEVLYGQEVLFIVH